MNRVELALQQRKQSILTANENELLTSIAYATTTGVIKKSNAKQYSSRFLGELRDNGIVIIKPKYAANSEWNFTLTDPGVLTDEN
ncbi:hypothetical protein [Lactiplantibacillus mudanjiangensis]|uniref:Tagatose-bisphosphate aldolase [Lactobacillus plantarum subsp. plantarum] n=1 Tax=Lactiplantibacillus mudanjiangensis TaxID=1296538 RepID=A0A660DYM3_9LACO|nr:hypothetical protein [Lactiplantibacillus mudanjiangensis]VDG25845.1 tagatose-bisphosphate aldolase [Lactobacillus plantarum subsp. plantarum] [Lactiplantibacillus mudanjiangensis]VDG28874.1 tagatose-bisphosphate aldolase [Lactobacillus plantarum subsp. plantarum] [Lactiplantibacillus mudanjiangensis]